MLLKKMLGNFLTRGLVLALGYAYPAFECFKTVEKNKVEIEELRFWCQYWIIVALITVVERVCDVLASWLPFYGEAKLALFIYMWYPKTKGSSYIYEAVVRPYIAKHETDIDRRILELRARAWDLTIYYFQNFSRVGAAKVFEIFQYLAAQSANVVRPGSQKGETQPPSNDGIPARPPSLSNMKPQQTKKLSRVPMPPPSPTSLRAVSQSPKFETVKTQLDHIAEETTIVEEDYAEETTIVEEDYAKETTVVEEDYVAVEQQKNGVDLSVHAAPVRRRRLHR